jgi:hypothetical protein
MRERELQLLRTPYDERGTGSLDDRFPGALSLGLRDLRALRDEIEGDVSEDAHGVKWWTTLPFPQRALIGDYLITCVHSIETNLVEAQLHNWELLDWFAQLDEFIGGSSTASNQGRPPRLQPRLAPVDDLSGHMIDIHIAGVSRALGSALDCLAAVIIGVVPMKIPIMKASFTRNLFAKWPSTTPPTTHGERRQAEFRATFMGELQAAGPEHWHDWVIGYRNMLVHRGRRIGTNCFVDRTHAGDQWGSEVVLPSEPELSQVEAWARWGNHLGCGQGSYNLTETAKDTLRRAQGAVARLAARTCEHLLPLWRARRAEPELLPQPAEQWPRIPCVKPGRFGGFNPGSFPTETDRTFG